MKKTKRFIALLGAVAIASGSFAIAACGDGTGEGGGEIEQFIAEARQATQSADYKSAVMTADMTMTAQQNAVTLTMEYGIEMEMDLETLDADISVTSPDQYMLKPAISYAFIRDMVNFSAEQTYESAVTDFTDVHLIASQSSQGGTDVSDILGQTGGMNMQALDTGTSFAAAALADKYGAVTLSDGSLSVNLIALASGLIGQLDDFVGGLTDQTTVGDVYDTDIAKNLIGACNYAIDAQDLYTILDSYASQVSFETPAPAEGQSLYDYIGVLLNDSNLWGRDEPLGSALLNDLYGATGVKGLKDSYAELRKVISVDDGSLTVNAGGQIIEISAFAIEYAFDGDGALTGADGKLSGTVTQNGVAVQMDMDMSFEYSEAEATLADISQALVYDGGEYITVEEYLAK